MKSSLKVILCYALAIAAMVAVIALVYRKTSAGDEPPAYGDFLNLVRREEVAKAEINYHKSTLTFWLFKRDRDGNLMDQNGKAVRLIQTGEGDDARFSLPEGVELALEREQSIRLADVDAAREDLMKNTEEQRDRGLGIALCKGGLDFVPRKTMPWWIYYLPGLLIIVALVFVYYFTMKRMMNAGGPAGARMSGFAKSHVKTPSDDKNKVTFRDVAGADEEKEELVEIVEYLKSPAKFSRLGARIPHGVLLMGPPGTGKTLLAKAVAGEAGVPFFSISGSDFVEMYVGVGASRVRDLFDTARKAGSAIIFIDEIDAVGRQRGTGLGGGHDEREQTLNQLLVELDGFGTHEGIVVIAATNRPDVLDPALLRPGRFDRQITVNRPNLKGREEILRVHARNKPLEPDVDLSVTARTTVGFTGADLANLLNEAALLAARRNKSLIGMDEIEDAFNKILMGPKKKAHIMSDAEKRNTAFHEAGHAMVGYLLHVDTVHLITIIPTGKGSLGYTSFRPETDRYQMYRQEYKNRIAMTLGGRAAEEIIFGDVTSGSSQDIKEATEIAKNMVTLFGMSDKLGPRCLGSDPGEVFLGRDFTAGADHSDATAAMIDDEVHDLIIEGYGVATELLHANLGKLNFLADYLIAHEEMDGDQFKAVMDTDGATVGMIEEIAAEKERKSRAANEARARAEEARKARERASEAAPEDPDGAEPAPPAAEDEAEPTEPTEPDGRPDGGADER